MFLNGTNFPEIAFGTYEEFILGYKPSVNNEEGKIELSQSFATHSHQASVRCIAAHGRYLVSSGADEYINIYDVLLKEVLTVINFHTSTVTCLEFVPDGSHLVSANQNGDIAIFSCNDWSLVKYWKEAHKTANGVISISVHPTGGLLLTAGADNAIRFWNLIKGRQAYAVNMSKKCSVGNSLNLAKWSSTGSCYVVCIGRVAEVYNTEAAAVIYTAECPTKISSIEFSTSDNLIIGLDNGLVQVHNLKKKEVVYERQCHKSRVKCLTAFSVASQIKNDKKRIKYLVTCDSGGLIKLWRLKIQKNVYSLLLKGQVDADCRLTCSTAIHYDVKEES